MTSALRAVMAVAWTPSLRWSLLDALLHAVMVGTAESWFGALAVELGHADVALALLVGLPPLIGALSQPLAGALSAHLGSRRRLVLAAATLQVVSLAGFVIVASGEMRSLLALLVVKIGFWVGALAAGPAWSDWICSLTRDGPRSRFFAFRSSLAHFVLLVAFTGAGASLDGALPEQRLDLLAQLCGIALFARLGSALALAQQVDAEPPPPRRGALARLARAIETSGWRVAVYVALLTFGTYVSAPFFTPFMLRELNLDYRSYAAVLATAILAKACAFPLVQRAADRFGLRPVLAVAGVAASSVPALFAASPGVETLMAAQVVSGAAWAGVELTSFQLLLANAKDEVRTEFISLATSLSGVLQLAGSLAGGLLLDQGGLSYHQVFFVSAAFRVVPVILLFTVVTDLAGPLPRLFLRIVSVRPGGGVVRNPILPPRNGSPSPRRRIEPLD